MVPLRDYFFCFSPELLLPQFLIAGDCVFALWSVVMKFSHLKNNHPVPSAPPNCVDGILHGIVLSSLNAESCL